MHITIDDGEVIIIRLSLNQFKLLYFAVRLGDLHDAIEIVWLRIYILNIRILLLLLLLLLFQAHNY